jgi:Arc/MetJ-type ribon-helix-helix transcriptional regulator
MNDVMVSIRMPRSLLAELRVLAEKKHFMDVSEEVRSIVRKRWIQYNKPELYEIRRLREEIGEAVKQRSIRITQKQIAEELEKIRDQLKEEVLFK